MIRGQTVFVWRATGLLYEERIGLAKSLSAERMWPSRFIHGGIGPINKECNDKYALIAGRERLLLLLFCFQIQILVCLDQPNGERNNLSFEPHHHLSNIKMKIRTKFVALAETVKCTSAKIFHRNLKN